MSTRLFLFGLFIVLFFILIPPIQQDLTYHQFMGDPCHSHPSSRSNVWSNVSFLVVGLFGFIYYKQSTSPKNIYMLWVAFGLIMTALGSTYYHLHPDNNTLFWDRLPMTIVFSGFFAAAWQYYYPSKGWRSLLCLLIGINSVLYWKWSLWMGFEDLRPYVLVQFLPIIVLMIWSIFYPNNTTYQRILIACLLIGYILAKMAEYWDEEIYHLTNHLISGHTLKHVLATVASYFMMLLIVDWKKS